MENLLCQIFRETTYEYFKVRKIQFDNLWSQLSLNDVETANLSFELIKIHVVYKYMNTNVINIFQHSKILIGTTFAFEFLAVHDFESQHCQSNNANYYNDP